MSAQVPDATPTVPVHPTMGDLGHLRAARAAFDAAATDAGSGATIDLVDHGDVTGGPTVGSLTELRFAHHAHASAAAAAATTPAQQDCVGPRHACPCCD